MMDLRNPSGCPPTGPSLLAGGGSCAPPSVVSTSSMPNRRWTPRPPACSCSIGSCLPSLQNRRPPMMSGAHRGPPSPNASRQSRCGSARAYGGGVLSAGQQDWHRSRQWSRRPRTGVTVTPARARQQRVERSSRGCCGGIAIRRCHLPGGRLGAVMKGSSRQGSRSIGTNRHVGTPVPLAQHVSGVARIAVSPRNC